MFAVTHIISSVVTCVGISGNIAWNTPGNTSCSNHTSGARRPLKVFYVTNTAVHARVTTHLHGRAPEGTTGLHRMGDRGYTYWARERLGGTIIGSL